MATSVHRNYQLPDPARTVKDEFWSFALTVLPAIDLDIHSLFVALGGKASVGHGHSIADIPGLQAELDAKMPGDTALRFAILQDVEGMADAPDGYIPVKVGTGIIMMAASSALGEHGHAVATASLDGFMGKADRVKLDGIAAGAQVNPGTATTLTPGLMGANDKIKLNGIQEGAQVNPGPATTASNGLLSATDKTKLDGLSSDANNRSRANHTGTQDIASTTTGTLPVERGGTGQSTEAGMRGAYTGTVLNNTVFPIGSHVIANNVAALRNGTEAIRIIADADTLFYGGSGGTTIATLAGTWRHRGGGLMQRVA